MGLQRWLKTVWVRKDMSHPNPLSKALSVSWTMGNAPLCFPTSLLSPWHSRPAMLPWEKWLTHLGAKPPLNWSRCTALWLPCVSESVTQPRVVLMGEEWLFSSLSSPPMPLLLATSHLHLVFKLLAPAQRMPCPFRGSEGCCTTPAFLSKWPWGMRMEKREDPHREKIHTAWACIASGPSLSGVEGCQGPA